MLTVEIAPDTEVQIETAFEGWLSQAQFEELIETAMMSAEVVDFLKSRPKMSVLPAPPPNRRPYPPRYMAVN